MTKQKYLSFEGLEKYDKLIKSYIAKCNKSLSDDVDVLKEDVATLKAIDHTVYATKTELASKQDAISDLGTIRSGAAAGATALQEVPAEYVTEGELTAKGYLTEDDLVYATEAEIDALFA